MGHPRDPRATTKNASEAVEQLRSGVAGGERELAESYELLRVLFDTTEVGLLLSDANAMPVIFNPAYARTMKELLSIDMRPGFQPHTLLPEEQKKQWEEFHRRALSGETFVVEHDFELPSGDVLTFETTYRPVFKDDTVSGFSEITRDITARKRTETEGEHLKAQLLQTQKLEGLGVMAGGIAHDFNNLLVGIIGNTSLALSDLPPDSQLRSVLEDVERAARRASELTNQMLAYAGKGRQALQPVALTALTQEMSRFLESTISKKTTLDYELAKELPAIDADSGQIRQVITNLITNAAESIGDQNGQITIATGVRTCDRFVLDELRPDVELPEGDYVTLTVTDTGCGMDEATLPKIYDPFFTTKFTGRGLGLASVHGIVRSHRGAIKVQSSIGRGSTFSVFLPASKVPAVMQPESGTDASPWHGSGTVLLVDDEETVRRVVSRMLSRLGFDVRIANDGAEALDLFRVEPEAFACVLLDLKMPLLDGEEVFFAMRRLRADVPVLLSSGYGKEAAAERLSATGLAGFIQKPYQLGVLREALQSVLEP